MFKPTHRIITTHPSFCTGPVVVEVREVLVPNKLGQEVKMMGLLDDEDIEESLHLWTERVYITADWQEYHWSEGVLVQEGEMLVRGMQTTLEVISR